MSFTEHLHATRTMDEIYKTLSESDKIKDSLDRNADALFSPFSEISGDIKAAKETAITDTAKIRSPEILNTRIAMELNTNRISEKNWENATTEGRITAMNKMFDIMMEEMQIPDKIRRELQLQFTGMGSKGGNLYVAGHCNRFVGPNAEGRFVITDKPVVEMHSGLQYQSFDTVLGSLYNQAIKVMQQATCIEPAGTYPDSVEQAKWAEEIMDQASGKVAQVSSMQQFALSAESDLKNRLRHIAKNREILNSYIQKPNESTRDYTKRLMSDKSVLPDTPRHVYSRYK